MIAVRTLSFILLIVGAIALPGWVLLPFALAYAFFFRAYELLVLAACIDAYFGIAAHLPYYTICTLIMLVSVEWLKPYLALHNR